MRNKEIQQNIATTPERSKRLLACGVKPETADMVWMDDTPPRLTLRTEIIEDGNPYILAPAWSLSRLISLLPPTIDEYDLYIFPSMTGAYWEINYIFEDERLFEYSTVSLIQTCVLTIEWLTANGYSLNNIEQ